MKLNFSHFTAQVRLLFYEKGNLKVGDSKLWWREESEWNWKENKLEKDKRGAYASMTWTEKIFELEDLTIFRTGGLEVPPLLKS